MKVVCVVGARPNFMKVAPLHRQLVSAGIDSMIVHTGQHYDEKMSDIFFQQLEMPEPDIYLGVGSGSHAQQTARVMTAFEEVVLDEKPDLVVVVGDVNSTIACALVSVKCHIPLAHVEAGLRSGDRRMPEEINRILTDSIANLLFVTEESGLRHLKSEGIPDEKIHFVGNLMIDSLVHFREKAAATRAVEKLERVEDEYALMTMHRPANVDSEDRLREVFATIRRIQDRLPLVFPMHPRTVQRFEEFGLSNKLDGLSNVEVLEPLGYLEFLRLMEKAAVVITDSGGIQEETTYLQVPCLTLRENTERPVTITEGTNQLIELDAQTVEDKLDEIISNKSKEGARPRLWDGKTAERIVKVIKEL